MIKAKRKGRKGRYKSSDLKKAWELGTVPYILLISIGFCHVFDLFPLKFLAFACSVGKEDHLEQIYFALLTYSTRIDVLALYTSTSPSLFIPSFILKGHKYYKL